MTDPTPWLTITEAAQRARYSRRTIMTALASEELRGHRKSDRAPWRIHVDDLDAWMRGETADVKVPAITRGRRATVEAARTAERAS